MTSYIFKEENISIDHESEDEVDGASCSMHRSKTEIELTTRNVHFEGPHTVGGRFSNGRTDTKFSGELMGTMAHHLGHTDRADAWQNTVLRKQKDSPNPWTEQQFIVEIADAMAKDTKLMTDDVDGEVRRRDAVRELSKSLTLKKEIKRRLSLCTMDRRKKMKRISSFKRWKYNCSLKFLKFTESVKAQIHNYSLWHKSLKEIEGMFGTGIGSYFKFLRILFLLNFFMGFIVICFLLIPQAIENGSGGSANPLQPKPNIDFVSDGTVFEPTLPASDGLENKTVVPAFGGFDWITGDGWMTYSMAFYRAYSTGIINTNYDMTLAYFFTIGCCFILYLGFLVHKVIKVYKENYIDTENEVGNSLVKVVFCGWDFNVTDKKASEQQHRRIYTELHELLEKCREEEMIDGVCTKILDFIPKVVAWMIIAAVLVGIYFLSAFIQEVVKETIDNTEGKYIVDSLVLLIYPAMANLILYTVPILLEHLVALERYKKMRDAVYATLIRTTLVELVVVGVLIYSWFTNDSTDNQENCHDCWETSLGQEIYRLLLVDFIFFLLTSAVFSVMILILNKKVENSKIVETFNKFNIARNTFHLIYNQTLLWAGFFFCPLTPVIVTIKFFFIFYIQKVIAINILRPESRPWRAAQMETFFLTLTLASLILSIVSFCFIIFNGFSSVNCGPFQGDKCDSYIFIINEKIGDDKLVEIVKFILKPGMIASILGILTIIVYCMKSIAEGRAEMVGTLRHQLDLEIRDRAFLLDLMNKLQSGQQTFHGHQIPSPRSPKLRKAEKEARQATRRSSSFFTPNKVYPDNNEQTSPLSTCHINEFGLEEIPSKAFY